MESAIKKSSLEIEAWLLKQISTHLSINIDKLDPNDSISTYGLGSLQMVTLAGDLELWLGLRELPSEMLYKTQSLRELAQAIAMLNQESIVTHLPMAASPSFDVANTSPASDPSQEPNVDDLHLEKIFTGSASRLSERIKESADLVHSTLRSGIYARKLLSQNDHIVTLLDYETQKPKKMVMMGSNNYLGLSCHPTVKERAKKAIDDFGTGMSGPYLLSGMTSLHEELEQRLAKLKGAEAALIYPTGYQTNIGWVAGLCRDGDVLVYDEMSHASFFDALMMAKAYFPGLQSFAFKHNNVDHLEQILSSVRSRKSAKHGQIFVTVEGVYSMDGDLAPLPEIRKVCDLHSALLAVDDAHGTLVLGEHGGGTGEHFGMEDRIDIVIGTFSKAFTSTGGFLAGKKDMIDYLRIFSRAHMFSAHLAPPTAGTILGCLDVVESEPQIFKKLHSNVKTLVAGLNEIGISVKGDCPILPIMIPAEIDIKEFAKQIHRDGIFVNPVMYPAVPKNQQRLRMNVMATHTPEDLKLAVHVLQKAGQDFGMLKRKAG